MQPQIQPKMQGPDDEGGMARADLYRAAKHSMKLFQMIQDNQQLEGWVQAKITKAADYLDSIYHYMEYQVKFGQGGVAASVDDITGDMETAARAAEEDSEKTEMEESMNYEQKLQALLESAVRKAKKDKKVDEDPNEGNEFSGALAKAKAAGQKEFKVDGKTHQVKEGFPTVADAKARAEKEKTTGKFDKKDVGTGTQYTRKASTFSDGGDDSDTKKAKAKAKVKEASTKFDPLKHVKNPTKGEKTAAKDVKRGSYADRAAMLRSAEKDGRLKEADSKCNHTEKGEKCPVHGLKECGSTMAYEAAKPSAGMTAKEKSALAKKASAGKDIGKSGKSFDKVAKSAGGGEKGKKIAAAAMWKNAAK